MPDLIGHLFVIAVIVMPDLIGHLSE